MKIWQMVALIAIVIAVYTVVNWPHKTNPNKEITELQKKYAPIEKCIDSLQTVIDSLKNKRYDTTIYVERWHKAATVNYISVDSLAKLLAKQQQLFEDSSYRKRYLLPHTDSVY